MNLQIEKALKGSPISLFLSEVPAGFPSPADGYLDEGIDLNELLIKNPPATFFVRVQGNSMQQANILSGDVLVVDRSLEAKNQDIVLALLNGEFTVKRILKKGEKLLLAPENPTFAPIEVNADEDFEVWGVITYVIHKAK